ncbi:MAG: Crp/Fnr family transcriptional regulator [Bacteroidota bacterium]
MHPFRKYLQQYVPLSDLEWEAIAQCLRREELKKGHILLPEGKICRKVYFLERGYLRFFFSKDGQTISKFFTQPPNFFTVIRSFTQELPSDQGIEVLEDSVVWGMSRADAYRLYRFPKWGEFVREIIQKVQLDTEDILEAIQTQTAEERYREMLAQNDPILQKAPLHYLASYLGIAPQSLSRIRKKMLFRT